MHAHLSANDNPGESFPDRNAPLPGLFSREDGWHPTPLGVFVAHEKTIESMEVHEAHAPRAR
jgi:hypothetical protein